MPTAARTHPAKLEADKPNLKSISAYDSGVRVEKAMSELPCCTMSIWVSELDLGHADSFEYTLGTCDRCGRYWMHAFCVATGTSGFAPVSATAAARMRSLPSGPERKAFMRAWGDEHV